MAEGVGFEPTVGYPTLDFESSALNRTQPPFPVSCIVDVNLRRAIIRRGAEFAKPKHHASLEYELENRGAIVQVGCERILMKIKTHGQRYRNADHL
jgi:hypothetical protein